MDYIINKDFFDGSFFKCNVIEHTAISNVISKDCGIVAFRCPTFLNEEYTKYCVTECEGKITMSDSLHFSYMLADVGLKYSTLFNLYFINYIGSILGAYLGGGVNIDNSTMSVLPESPSEESLCINLNLGKYCDMFYRGHIILNIKSNMNLYDLTLEEDKVEYFMGDVVKTFYNINNNINKETYRLFK